ncbi:Low molecular weight protein-tyrosine-phosphatase [Spironucleus salmonicida]|uniref:protein-tyrosine-phosphatase n=1 Tax=Spironucleus salmonicida TaxID=348837 RepID=V6LE79_9EUKA|nr:Low molecular weight protein-tyrosine-phosphatase [Spironucleus salmonicida]|eukprot:EST42583.1 Low molecular weight protein-tyrosine-phosphatase [Spironucleus salmonicida]
MKIMFVCLGNICRSPLAHGIALYYAKKDNLKNIEFESCGMYGEPEGCSTHRGSQKIIKERLNFTFTKPSRHWQRTDYDTYDLILCMDNSNKNDVMDDLKGKDSQQKVKLFREFDPKGTGEVPDPYYTGGFDLVFDMCERTVINLLDMVKTNKLQ